ncbi:LamG-like jellyroll fold domain-containing protein [Lacihabitans sp. LS3-19]|uniref:LamG-like jellyroll fold domain-containing protein n=1 Tax=Lacihabitans sp. LS3-19 TaxID=2487335 RepID=UPI0020CF1491|nr:LamG-like jellyroll fold domain-containing protein [Lacihabitans sp. LS3-19]
MIENSISSTGTPAFNNVTQSFVSTATGNMTMLRIFTGHNVNDGQFHTTSVKLEIFDQGNIIGTQTASITYAAVSDFPLDFTFDNIAVSLVANRTYSFRLSNQTSETIMFRTNNAYPFGTNSLPTRSDVRFVMNMHVDNPLHIAPNNFTCAEFPVLHITDGGFIGPDYNLFRNGSLFKTIKVDSIEILDDGAYHVQKTVFPGCTIISDTATFQSLPINKDTTVAIQDSILLRGQFYQIGENPSFNDLDNNGCLVRRINFKLIPNKITPQVSPCETVLNTVNNTEIFQGTGPLLRDSSFTFSVWAKRTRLNRTEVYYRLGSENAVDRAIHLGFRDTNAVLFGFFGDDLEFAPPTVDLNWHHYVFTYDATTKQQEIYVDGTLLAQKLALGNFVGNRTVTLGAFSGTGDSFNGFLEDFQVWRKKLNSSEIIDLYRLNNSVQTASKLVHFKFNDIRGVQKLKNSADNTFFDITNINTNTQQTDSLGRVGGATYSSITLRPLTGTTVVLNGNSYTQDSTFTDTLQTTAGCDSMVNYTLFFITLKEPVLENCTTVLNLNGLSFQKTTDPLGPDLVNKSFSVAVWAKRKRLNTTEVFYSMGETSVNSHKGLHLGWRPDGKVFMGFLSADTEIDQPQDTLWHHYAFVFDNAQSLRKIYKDGKFIGQGSGTAFTGDRTQFLGAFRNGEVRFKGQLEDLQIWDSVLGQADIDSLFNQNNEVQTANRKLFYDFNEVRGADVLTNRADGSIVNLTTLNSLQIFTDLNAVPAGPITTDHLLTAALGDTISYKGLKFTADTTFTDSLLTTIGCDSLVKVSVSFFINPLEEECSTVLKLDGSKFETFANGPVLANKSFTISSWARRKDSALDKNEIFFSLGDVETTGNLIHLGWQPNGNVLFGFLGADLTIPQTKDNFWHHYSFSFDVTTGIRTIRKDGKKIAEATGVAFTGSQIITLGSYKNGGSKFNGLLEDLQVWDKVLDSAEVAQLIAGNNAISLNNKLLHYDFNDFRNVNELTNRVNGEVNSLGQISNASALVNQNELPDGKTGSFTITNKAPGDSVIVANLTVFSDTTLIDTLVNSLGCDSVLIHKITFKNFLENCTSVLHLNNEIQDLSGGPNLANSSFSIAVWVKRQKVVNGSGPTEVYFRLGSENNNNRAIHLGFRDTGKILFGFFSNDMEVTKPQDNNWHHYVFTYQSGNTTATRIQKIYHDGVLLGSRNSNGNFSGNSQMKLGAFSNVADSFKGFLEDLQIWNTTLSAADVTALFNRENNIKNSQKLIFWDFNETRGNAVLTNKVDNTIHELTDLNDLIAFTDTLGNPSGPSTSYNFTTQKIGTTVEINGLQISSDTSYTDTLVNAAGCDSLSIYDVVFDRQLNPNEDACNTVLQLDGTQSQIFNNAGPALSGSSLTFSLWLKRDRINTEEIYLTQGTESANNKTLHLGFRTNNNILFGFGGNDLEVNRNQDLLWHHYVFVYDKNAGSNEKKKIYVDGELIGTGGGGDFTGNRNIILGSFQNIYGPFEGMMEDLEIWDTALTASEIDSLHFQKRNVSLNSKRLFWNFNENVGENVLTNSVDNTTVSLSAFDRDTDIVNLSGNPSGKSVSIVNETSCTVYEFNGTILSSSGTYIDTLVNSFGCDSIVILNLTVNIISEEVNVQACNSYLFGGQTLTISGTYIDTLSTQAGCDSIVTLNLTMLAPDSTFITETACDVFDFFGQNLDESGRYYHTLQNTAGCDSVIALDLTFNRSPFTEITVITCGSYFFHDSLFTQSTTYSFSVPSSNGCDSVVVLGLIIKQASSSQVSVSQCGPYQFNGITLSSSGIYHDTLTNAAGCDSIITLNLTILPQSTASINITACNSFDFNGTVLTASGIYKDTLVNAAGCDSIITLHLTIATPVTATLSGNAVIAPGGTATLSVVFTGTAPYTVVINGVTHGGVSANPFLLPVSPTATTTYSVTSVSNSSCGEGTASGSATVTVENSPCPPNLIVPISVNKIYRAQNQLKSSVNASHQTSYSAGGSIVLEPGFQVGSNETFEAKIKGCDN